MKITLRQIADKSATSFNTIRSRALRESWPSCGTTIVNHNETKMYSLADLPADIRTKIEQASSIVPPLYCPAPALQVSPARGFFPADKQASKPSRINAVPITAIPEEAKKIALARMDLLRNWESFRGRFSTLAQGDAEFEAWYNTGHGAPHLYDILGGTSAKTLSRLKKQLGGSNDWTLLVPNYNYSGMVLQTSLDMPVRRIFERFMLDPRRLKISQCIFYTREALNLQGLPCDSADAAFYRYADWFQKTHNDVWTFRREGNKALMDKVLLYIKRDPGMLQVGDCLVADGHRMNFQIVNPFTGKPARATMIGYLDWKSYDLAGYEIMIEENTQAIASALRHGVLKLGKLPRFSYQDNGKAFRSKYFTHSPSFEESGFFGLFARFNIVPVFSMPYNARAKVIERWWGIFSESFERLLPSYVGASIDDKPAYLMRNEKFHKALRGDYTPTIWEAVDMIDQWLSLWSSRTECPHVKGKTVRQVFDEGRGPGIDAAELDDLMMDAKVAKLYQNGVRIFGGYYWDEALYGKQYDDVVVRYSIFDKSQIRVYRENGAFLCTAKRSEDMNPLVNYLGTEAQKDSFKNVIQMRARLRKGTLQQARQIEEAPLPIAVNAGAVPQQPAPQQVAGVAPGALMVQQAEAPTQTIESMRSTELPPLEEGRPKLKLALFECDLEKTNS